MTDDERGYYERRAEKQLLMAAATEDRNACASHYTLANLYLELATEAETEAETGAEEPGAERSDAGG